jgi:plasmid stabilization system protein ParE
VPHIGTLRDDLRKNVRIRAFDDIVVAAYEIDDKKRRVIILNLFFGKQDCKILMKGLDGVEMGEQQ